MKKSFILALCILLVTVIFAMGVSPQTVDPEGRELLDAAIAGETAMMKIGVASLDALCQQLETGALAPNAALPQAADLLKEQNVTEHIDMSDYYTGSLASQYQGMLDTTDALWQEPNENWFELAVDSGTTQGRLLHVEAVSETEKKVKFSCVGWLTSIYERGGRYTVRVIFNRDTLEKTMVQENRQWKIQSMESDNKEFAPDSYEPDQGAFDTLEEALECARKLDVNKLNPFRPV